MPAAFLHTDLVAAATSISEVGTAALAALPLANLRDPQPRIRTRWQPASASVVVDLGVLTSLSCVALIGTSFGAAGGSPTVRVRLATDSGFGIITWDTTAGDPATTAAANGNIVVLRSTAAAGRYLRVDLTDPAASLLDVGRLVAGPLWRLSHGPSFGMAEGRMMLDRRDRNSFTGAEFPVPAVRNPRQATFTLPLISAADAIGEYRTMRDTLGAVGDVLWIPDDSLSRAELNQRCIWGAVAQPGESALLPRTHFAVHSRSFTITERS